MSDVSKARVSLNLPASLKSAAEEFAERDGVSLNQFISVALAEKVGAQKAAVFFTERGKDSNVDRALQFLAASPDEAPQEDDRLS